VSSRAVSNRIAARYAGRSLQGYARWKVRFDPIYRGVLEALRDVRTPVADVGCGIGLLSFHLREHGVSVPVTGIDFDERKIAAARHAARNDSGLSFRTGDARDAIPAGHSVVLLDILHYFDAESQRRILSNAARATPPGGLVVIRQPLRDRSWRYRLTAVVDAIGRAIRWNRAETLRYPTREEVLAPFTAFDATVGPLWGRTPYNTYLFVLRRR
jgi:2-polyprenyl-3-methyl-5-hydroxy-6-metoxy-1,4-benzoquinol methylase